MQTKRFSFEYYEGEDCSVNIPDFDTIAEAKKFFDYFCIATSTVRITEWDLEFADDEYQCPIRIASANFYAVIRDGVDSLESYVKY